jgi:hypothetical protein
MTSYAPLDAHLTKIIESVYFICGFTMSNLKIKSEGVAYGACSFDLNGLKIEHRTSRVTPTKTGQFVTIWKRGRDGLTIPFDKADDIDIVIITSSRGDDLGQFIFPKTVLVEKGIFSQNGKGGKRGIRVYPPWDKTHSKQAASTQRWQQEYFIAIQGGDSTDPARIRQLFNAD